MRHARFIFFVLCCIGCGHESEKTEEATEHSKSDRLDDKQPRQVATRYPLIVDDERGYTVYTESSGEKIRLVFEGVPESVHALSSAPEKMEPILKRGRWLILVYAGYSVPDAGCIPEAIEVALALKDQVRIGIRRYWVESEHETWCPACAVTDNVATPVWVILEDGKTLGIRRGVIKKEQIIAWFEKTVSKQ